MPTKLDKEIAKHVSAPFGCREKPKIWEHRDETDKYAVDVLSCADVPKKGYTSFSTVTLHHTPVDVRGNPVLTELAGVVETTVKEFENVLGTAAFYVIKDGWTAVPGAVLRDVVGDYGLSRTHIHLLLVPPFPWTEELNEFKASSGESIHWLLAMPISESERQFLEDKGFDELEDIFAEKEIPYFDLERDPAV